MMCMWGCPVCTGRLNQTFPMAWKLPSLSGIRGAAETFLFLSPCARLTSAVAPLLPAFFFFFKHQFWPLNSDPHEASPQLLYLIFR